MKTTLLIPDFRGPSFSKRRLPPILLALALFPMNLFAWTNGELLIWMDNDRAKGLAPIAQKFQDDFGIKITIDTPENITDAFPMAAQAGKGPDVVVWAHDKVGEWADAGLIRPIEVSDEFSRKFFPKAWQAVLHRGCLWGYPIGLETVTLIYNKNLWTGSPPADLTQLVSMSQEMKTRNPAVIPILWDYKSAFYSWGILASAGAYVFAKAGTNYDLQNIGVANPRAIEGLSEIIALIKAGVLPKSVSYSVTEELMGQGKLAMTISGPWAWPNLVKSGIDFALAPIPGVHGNVGRPFVGVSVAYFNRSSPNQDLTEEFLENYFLTEQGLRAADDAKPIGVPALISLYERMAKDSALLRELKAGVDQGQIMPNVPQMGCFFSALGTALQIATEGHASPEAASQEAEAIMRER
ncbi:MAG TPA: maltose/maltodextrin ABC transporter substrate-binding protein MalE [Chthoniobacterales bacterium]|nr:maltose/maltodextrin ABC transporter substrate-binding protein MalE [Chthoniobacterales bacterium]